MHRLRLAARPPELGPLVIRSPLLSRAVSLGLLAYGLLILGSDLGHVRGECCTPSYWNYFPAIEFSGVWVCLVGLVVVNTYRKVVFAGQEVRVSWLGGLLSRRMPVERVRVSEVEVTARDGSKTLALRLRLGRISVSVGSEDDGYGQLRLSLQDVGERH